MRSLLATTGLGCLVLLSACSTATPYGPAFDSRYGFSETQIEQNRWTVGFSGNSLTDLKTVESYLLYRAAELTDQQGFDYFVMVDRKVDEDSQFQSTGFGPNYSPFRMQYYSPRWGWRNPYDPYFNDVTLREVTKYEALAEIVMGKGPKPATDPKAYDAEDVLITMAPKIQRAGAL